MQIFKKRQKLGEGFFVKIDGITIFHGGDHESSDQSWNKFTKEIDYLNELKEDIKKFTYFACPFLKTLTPLFA